MKKRILLLFACSFFISCTNSDEQQSEVDLNDNFFKIKKIIENSPVGLTETNYIWNGSKIIECNNGIKSVFYTYDNSLLTNITSKINNVLVSKSTLVYSPTNNIVHTVEEFYNNGLLISVYKNFISYNSDNTITKAYYKVTNNINELECTTKYVLNSLGNIVSVEKNYVNGTIQNYVYTYDDKNNVFKNALGLKDVSFVYNDTAFLNNILSSVGNGDYSSVFSYNSSSFPVNEVKTNINTNVITNKEFIYY